jgi:hypothetical protein
MLNVLELKPNIIISDLQEGRILLNAWKSYQSRQGNYGSKSSSETSNGLIKVYINGRQVDYVKTTTQEQVNSVKFLADNDEVIQNAILKSIFNKMTDYKETYEELMPEIESQDQLKNYIGLSTIHIMESDKDDFSYVGFEIGCEWDEEHGIGVMTHKDRVVEVGLADASFNSWITYADNGTLQEEEERWNRENSTLINNVVKVKKPWWKLW